MCPGWAELGKRAVGLSVSFLNRSVDILLYFNFQIKENARTFTFVMFNLIKCHCWVD